MPYYLTRKIRELKFEEYAFLFVVIVVVVYAMNRVKLFRIGWKYQFKTDEIFYGVKILLLQKKCIRETSIIAFQNFVSLSRTNVLTFIDKYRGKASKLIDKLNLKSEIQSHVRVTRIAKFFSYSALIQKLMGEKRENSVHANC